VDLKFSVEFTMIAVQAAILALPRHWAQAINTDGSPREGAGVAESVDCPRLRNSATTVHHYCTAR
jgi:hypothetical protein